MKKNQAALWLAFSRDAEPLQRLQRLRCNSTNLMAAPPFGSSVLPVAMSPTVETAVPIDEAISESVKPEACRALTLDDQEVGFMLMEPDITARRNSCQRPAVTEFRPNSHMVKKDGHSLLTLGARVRHWRKVRGMTQGELAAAIGAGAPSTISDLENDRSMKSYSVPALAKALNVSISYLETGKGDPEGKEAIHDFEWPLDVDPELLTGLSTIEKKYAALKLTEVLQEIAVAKPKRNAR